MTRLTNPQIAEAWIESLSTAGIQPLAFAHRIAALAVQEVERGVDPMFKTAYERTVILLSDENKAHVETKKQLTEVTKERDNAWRVREADRKDMLLAIRNADRMTDEVASLRAQLATAKREVREVALQIAQDAAMEVAKHFTMHQFPRNWEGCTPIAHAIVQKHYPATPSGAAHWDISEPRNLATPSPEAREVDSEFLLRVVQEVNAYAVITPADAKRIVRLAQEAE